MKSKLILALVAAAVVTSQIGSAQTAPTAMNKDVLAVRTKFAAKLKEANTPGGKKLTEADVKDEIKSLDEIITKNKTEKPDDAAAALQLKAQIYSFAGNRDEYTKSMETLKKDYAETKLGKAMKQAEEKQAAASAEREAAFAKLMDSSATEIKATKTLGDFKGLGALKGKVVVLDFFAHWCGPCKAALPSVREMYDGLKGKGLEVVGVTRFYGTYGTEKGLSPDQEYERMKQFVVDQKINWPVAFTDSAAFKDYAVSGIPHVVVIDRAGKIRKIKVGYNKAGVEEFHKEIEKLLAS